jgi:hypothetical protein
MFTALKPRVVCAVLAFAMAAELLPLAVSARRGTEFRGVTEELDNLSRLIPEDNALVLVDHFIYATPLNFVFGKDVLVVSDLHGSDKAAAKGKMAAALKVIERESENRPVYVFTITRAGLDYFPVAIPCESQTLFDKPMSIPRMIHHRDRHPFEREYVKRRFRLYKFNG